MLLTYTNGSVFLGCNIDHAKVVWKHNGVDMLAMQHGKGKKR